MEKQKDLSIFNCFICSQSFSSRHSLNRGGKVPLVLECGHNACDACITRLIKCPGDTLTCQLCNAVSTASDNYTPAKPDSEFPINSIILGQLVTKNLSGWDDNKISFSMPSKMVSLANTILCHECVERRAECNCVQCKVPYCGICFNRAHQSAKAFKDHTRTNISSTDSISIEVKCPIHKDQNKQFWCSQCSAAVCSNCLLQSHNGHSNVSLLTDKNVSCFKDLLTSHVNVTNIQSRLKATKKKAMCSISINKFENPNCKDVEKEIRDHFSRLHGLLIAKEHKLLNKLYSPYRGTANSLKTMIQQMDSTIEELEQLLQISTALYENDIKYLNCASYYDIVEKLRQKETTPCYLIMSEDTQANSTKFLYDDSIFNVLDDHGDVDATDHVPTYRMVTEDELPPDYQINPIKAISVENFKGFSSLVVPNSTSNSSVVSPATSMHSLGSAIFSEQIARPQPTPEPVTTECGNKNFDELVEGCKVSVTVTHTISPNDFYVRRIGLEKKLHEIGEIFNHANAAQFMKIPSLDRIKPGDHFMAQFSQDSKWYRGMALEVNDGLITIFYIDFGNTEAVKRDKLRVMISSLMKYDGMAVHCSLHDCRPYAKEWAPQAIATLLKIVDRGDVSISIRKRTSNMLFVDLMRSDSLDEVNLRQALIFLGYAKSTDPSSPNMKIETIANQRPLPASKTFQNGHILDGVLTHCTSPYEFYFRDINSFNTLKRLQDGLTEMYSRKSERMIVYHPKIGMIVAAMNMDDNQWRRAKIISVPELKRVEVMYLDYGNSEIISFKRLRNLGHKFFKVGLQCFRCSLLDIAPIDGGCTWSAKSLERFNLLLQDNPKISQKSKFRLVIHSYNNDRYLVALYKEQGDVTLSINAALVNEKVALSTGLNSTILQIPSRIQEASCSPQVVKDVASSGIASPVDFIKPPALPSDIIIEKVTLLKRQELPPSKPSGSGSDPPPCMGSLPSLLDVPIKPPESDNVATTSTAKVARTKEGEPIKIPVHIVKVISPSEFYITLTSMVPKLKQLNSNMQKYYSRKGVKLEDVKESTTCVIKREEGDWCRAFIVSVNESTAEVLLPDLGGKLEVPKDTIYPLVEKFQDLRDGATRCHLGGLKEPLEDRWPMTSTDEIREFAEKYDGKIYITKLGQERANSMPVEVLMKEEKAAGALEPMKITWTSLNNNLRMRGLALADGTIDWDVEDFKFTAFRQQIPRLQTDIFKGMPIKYAGIANNDEIGVVDDISNSESIFGSTLKLTDVDFDTSLTESMTGDDDAANEQIGTVALMSQDHPLPEGSAQTIEEKIPAPFPMPVPTMPKAWPTAVPFSRLEFIASPTNVNNDASIFIQDFQKSVSILNKIGNILDGHCRMSLPMSHDMYWTAGQTCIARYHLDQKWYRGVVKSIKEDNTVMVELVDYGNIEECSASDLRKIPLAVDIPIQGQFCKLTKIKANNPERKWSIPVLDKVHALVVEKHSQVQLSFNQFDQQYCIESLKLPDGSEMVSHLVMIGLAVYDDSPLPQSIVAIESSANASDNPLADALLKNHNSEQEDICEELSRTNISDLKPEEIFSETELKVISAVDPKWKVSSWAIESEAFAEASEAAEREFAEERNRQLSQSPSFDELCDLYDVNPAFLAHEEVDFLSDSQAFSYQYLEIPSNLKRFEVEIGALINADTVSFQIVDSNDLKLNFSRNKFTELTETLQNEAPLQPVLDMPQLNDACCAQYSSDANWYRAMILEINGNEALIKYVDYGNMENMPLNHLREIKEIWTLVQVQSFVAKLHNLTLGSDSVNNSQLVRHKMEEELFDGKLTAVVIAREPQLTIELYKDNELAYQSLIDDGLLKLSE